MFEVPQAAAGRLWIMPRPQDLSDDIARYKAAGVSHIVSLLTSDEAAQLGLSEEGSVCEKTGLAFLHHPIVDFGLPDLERFTPFVRNLNELLHQGHGVAVHCRAGIGRSGMATCAVLVLQGLDAQDAVAQVSAARGAQVPDTAEQSAFIATFAHNL